MDNQLVRSTVHAGNTDVYGSAALPGEIWIGMGKFYQATYYKGALDDIRVYNRVLSPTDINALYSENNWPASSPDSSISFSFRATSDTNICPGDTALLQLGGTADSFSWNTMEGVTQGTPGVFKASPKETTTYIVTAERQYSGEPCPQVARRQQQVTIVVRQGPDVTGGSQYVCRGKPSEPLSANVSGGKQPYTYLWSPSTGLDNPRIASPTTTVNSSITYTVRVTDANGCSDTANVSVTVIDPPTVDIVKIRGTDTTAIDSLFFCRGSRGVELVARTRGANGTITYSWKDNVALNRTDSSHVRANPNVTTRYIVEVKDQAGICPVYDTVLLIPTDAPIADAGSDQSICAKSSVQLGTPAITGMTYTWTPSTNLSSSTAAQPTATPTTSTTYYLTVTDPRTDCSSIDSVRVEIRDVKVTGPSNTIDLGTLDGCKTGQETVVTLMNAGSTTATVDSIRSTVPGITLLASNPTVPGNSNRDLLLRFAPSASGSYSGTVTFYIGPCRDSVVVNVTGSKEQSSIGLDLGSIDFGRMASCAINSIDTVITLTNSGTAATDIAAPIVGSPFSITGPTLPTTVAAGQTIQLTLRYAPGGPGSFSDVLKLPFTAGACSDTLLVNLSGIVEDVKLDGNISSLDFGLLDGCTASGDSTIMVTNTSSFPITIDRSTLPSGYSLLDNLPATVPPNSTKVLRLRFAPAVTGIANGTAQLHYEPCDATLSIDLTGEKRGVSFAIVDSLNFGELVSCEGSSTTLPLSVLLNSAGTGDGQIRSVAITGPFSSDITNGTILTDGTAKNFSVTFTPTTTGPAVGEIILTLDPCGVERHIYLTGSSSEASLTAGSLNFGLVPSGSTTSSTLTYTNDGTTDLHIDRLAEPAGFAPSFRVVSTTPTLPGTLKPGEKLTVTVEFRATAGVSSSTLDAIVDLPCAITSTATIRGEGESTGFARIALPVLSAAPGAPVAIAITLDSASGLDAVNAHTFRAEIEVESSMLVLDDGSLTQSVIGKHRIVTVEGTQVDGNAVLATLPMMATLGRVESAPIRLVSFTWTDATMESIPIDTINGSFTLTGLCREGGVRLFDPGGEIAIKSVVPNPSREKARIVYSLVEPGEHRFRLMDITGKAVVDIFDGTFVPGTYEVTLDVSSVASGVYYLLLETPTVVLTKKVDVTK